MSASEFDSGTAQPLAGAQAAMDRMYRHQRHIYDASRKFYLLGRDTLIRTLDPPPGGHVLEIGCGTGRNLIAAANRYPDAHFHGGDISEEMLKTASSAIARAGLQGRIALAQADATCFDPARVFRSSHFDRIFLSYAVSMIPDWEQAIAHALGMLAPGGQLHLVDFGQCEQLPAPARAALFAWLGLFSVAPRDGLLRVLRAECAERNCRVNFRPLYRGYAWYAMVERR